MDLLSAYMHQSLWRGSKRGTGSKRMGERNAVLFWENRHIDDIKTAFSSFSFWRFYQTTPYRIRSAMPMEKRYKTRRISCKGNINFIDSLFFIPFLISFLIRIIIHFRYVGGVTRSPCMMLMKYLKKKKLMMEGSLEATCLWTP